MAAITGKNGRVLYGSVVVADQVEWSMSGFSQAVSEKPTAFTDTVKVFEATEPGDPGTISFSGNYDPADTTGQAAVSALCEAGTSVSNLYLYANTSTFWRVGLGGSIIVTKGKAISLPRNGYGKISFEGKVTTKSMEQVGSGS